MTAAASNSAELADEMFSRAERVFWARMWACRRTGDIDAYDASNLAIGDVVDDILGIDVGAEETEKPLHPYRGFSAPSQPKPKAVV